MTTPLTALTASKREPVLAAAPAKKISGPATETEMPNGVKKTPQPTANEKTEALAEINDSLRMASIGVRFEFDKEADMMIAKVVDVESGDVIRQMPSEEVVHISKVLGKLQGLLVSQKV